MSDTAAVAVSDLTKTYRSGLIRRKSVNALKGVSLDVSRGEIFGLLGPNGAGKTTLIKILLGIVRGTSGNASVLGHAAGKRRGRLAVGYLPENHRIPRHLTGNSALDYYGQLSHMPLREIRSKRQPLLDQVGLGKWGREPVRNYSKGMLQRLGLAQAMLHNPELLILDEPTDGVDPKGRADIREVLFRLKEQGRTVFLNSHLLQEIELVCDRVAVLERGTVRHLGPIRNLTDTENNDIEIRVAGDRAAVERELSSAGQTLQVQSAENGLVTLKGPVPDQSELDAIIDVLRAADLSIQSITRDRRTLEEAFLQLIGREPSEGNDRP